MKTGLKTISRWLDEDKTNHHMDEEKNLIVFGATGDVQTGHFIRLREDGDLFVYQIQMREEDNSNKQIPANHKHILELLKYLLRENYNTKFGCWEYDYNDGDIRYSIEIPLEDAEMTQKQFERITSLAYRNVDTMMSNINKLLETGEIPENDDSASDMIKQLMAQAYAEGQKSSSSKSSESGKSLSYDDNDGI